MKVGSGSTSESLKCIACNKTTCDYDSMDHAGLKLTVPVCKICSNDLRLNKFVANKISEIKREILLREVTG